MSGAEAWRERVEDVLWVELGRDSRMSATRTGTLGPGAPSRPGPEAVEAFASLGLLSPAAAEDWRERFTRDEEWRPAVERERLHAYLGELARRTADGNDGAMHRYAALHMLWQLGLIDREDLEWWGSLGRIEGGPPMPPEPPPCRLGRRLRTLPGPAERRRGVRLVLLDLFEDGVCLHLQVARHGRDGTGVLPPLADERTPGVPLAPEPLLIVLEDDLGTRYHPSSSGGSSSGGPVDGPLTRERTWLFRGAVPDGASRLTARHDGDAFEVPL